VHERLATLANHLAQLRVGLDVAEAELRALASQIPRRKLAGPRAPATSARMTPALARQIRAYKKANPDLGNAAIGFQFNVNQGRVSEALRGKRT
jgi:hypothetical protein